MKTKLFSAVVVAVLCAGSAFAQAAGPDKRISHEEAAKLTIRAPRPGYPIEARQMKITGSGVVVIKVNTAGIVTSTTMRQSTGSPILDRAALLGFKRWRFKPGQGFFFWCPITFTMAGASY